MVLSNQIVFSVKRNLVINFMHYIITFAADV